MSSNSEPFDISFLSGSNAAFIEDLYDRYAADPNSVDESWRTLFSSLGKGVTAFKPAWGLKNGNGMTGVLAEEYLPPAPKAAKKPNGGAAPAAAKAPGATVIEALAKPSADAIKTAALVWFMVGTFDAFVPRGAGISAPRRGRGARPASS